MTTYERLIETATAPIRDKGLSYGIAGSRETGVEVSVVVRRNGRSGRKHLHHRWTQHGSTITGADAKAILDRHDAD